MTHPSQRLSEADRAWIARLPSDPAALPPGAAGRLRSLRRRAASDERSLIDSVLRPAEATRSEARRAEVADLEAEASRRRAERASSSEGRASRQSARLAVERQVRSRLRGRAVEDVDRAVAEALDRFDARRVPVGDDAA